MTDDLFLAWAAGFFDGEGCVIIEISKEKRCRHGFRTALHVHVTQTSIPCLEKFLSRFGGRLTTSEHTTPNGRRWAVQYRWGAKNEEAASFLRLIYPYTVVKKSQIEVALKYPLTSPDGRKYGNTTNPIPDDIQQFRVNLCHELRAIRSSMKTMAKPWEPANA